MRKFLLAIAAVFFGAVAAQAHTVTLTWTWPTTRADGSTLALSSIGGATIYNTAIPAPGAPGTAVVCAVTIPPTAATGTCTTGTLAPGTYTFVIVTTDNASPPDASPVSNSVSVTVPLSGPSAITNLSGTLN